MDKTFAALQIGRHRHIYLLGIWQIELSHDLDELGQRLAASQARIALPLLSDRGDVTMLIVVRWVDERVLGQRKDLRVDRLVKSFGAPILDIRPSAPVAEQSIGRASCRDRV